MFKTALATTALAASTLSAHAVTLVQWDFESVTAPAASTSWTGVAASTGTGTASGVHAASTTWSTFAGNGSAKSFSANTWAVNDYWQFAFSTVGYTGVSVTFDQTGSNSGPRDFAVAYSTNGSTFTNFASYALTNVTWSGITPAAGSSFSFDLSAVTALNNNATVFIRLVDTSTVSINALTVGAAGTNRVDNFTVIATAVPEADTAAMLAAGLAALAFLVKRRKA